MKGHLFKVFWLFKALCLCLIFSCLPSLGLAEELAEVKAIRHWPTNETVRVVVDITGAVEFSKGRLSNPERLFFDLKNSKLQKGIQTNYPIGEGSIKMIRLGQFNANTVRIVFDLERADYDFKVFTLEDPTRLVIDFATKTGIIQEKPKEQEKIQEKIQEKEKPVNTKTEAKVVKKRVVIDPGHGGHDPGAVGLTGLYEKDVVLDIALKAKEHINRQYPHYEVHLTRDTDVFIPLEKRAQIANNLRADLFISVHANASPNRSARGIETYLLNWTDDEEALKVAARENSISIKQMREMKNELSIILTSLERESKRDESVKAAGYVQNTLTSFVSHDYPAVPDLGVKQALFYVLVGAKMPSILAEVSFISNREEERLLSAEDYRDKLGYAIAEGVNGYFLNLPADRIAKYGKPQLPEKKSPKAELVKYENKKTTKNKPVKKNVKPASKKTSTRRV